MAASDATLTWTSCRPWSARLRSEAFLRERVRELEASELALAQALSLDERHGVPPHLDADVCLATYLSVQTLERERRSMVMRPALREQERRLRLFLRRKEEARRLQLMRQLPDDLISHVLELADRRLAVQACQEAIRARQRIGKLLDNVLSARSMLTNVFCVRHGMV